MPILGAGPRVEEAGIVDADEAKTVGALLRKIRLKRGLSQEVVAGLAGFTGGFLSQVERGLVPLERLSHWKGVASALGVPLSDLLRLELPAPGNGDTDHTIEAVRDALDAVAAGYPGGEVLPVSVLQQRVTRVHRLHRQVQFKDTGRALPELIRDLHTTVAAGRDLDVLLPLAVLLHVHVTGTWLDRAEATTELRRQAGFLALNLAREHNDTASLASAAYGLTRTLVIGGSFALAKTVLDNTTLPPITQETAGIMCATLTTPRALLIAAQGDDPRAPLDEAAEITDRFGLIGVVDRYGFYFGPTNVDTRRIGAALELGDVDEAARSVHAARPERHPARSVQALYWRYAGRTLAAAGGPVEEPVRAYLRAEALNPVKLYRNLTSREVLRELLTRAPDNEQLQQLANRAELDQR
ncbi:MAG: helix-turn-helix domain-containing protein [Pseudonocardiaceae bacterium]